MHPRARAHTHTERERERERERDICSLCQEVVISHLKRSGTAFGFDALFAVNGVRGFLTMVRY